MNVLEPTAVGQPLPFRQVHLDFHTSPHIEDVGVDFDARDFVRTLQRAAALHDIDVSIWYTGCDEGRARELAPGSFTYHEQTGDDLGSRMGNAFQTMFRNRYEQVALIGTDCPELDENVIGEAFDVLSDVDVGLGPARDGGYYLIALRAPAPGLFQGIPWGSEQVLEATVRAAETLGLSAEGLPLLWDVDRPDLRARLSCESRRACGTGATDSRSWRHLCNAPSQRGGSVDPGHRRGN